MKVTIENKTFTYSELRSHDVVSFGETAKLLGVKNHSLGRELKLNHIPLHNELRKKYQAKRAQIYRDQNSNSDIGGLIEIDVACHRCGAHIVVEIEKDHTERMIKVCQKCKNRVHELRPQ